MDTVDLVIRAQRVISTAGEVARCIGVKDGTHRRDRAARTPTSRPTPCWSSATTRCCCPGIVDSHVHVNDPGRTEWEGFTSATRAAAAGGVTTIVDMPLNSIPPTVRPGRARGEAEDRRAAGVRRRRLLGRRRPGQRRPICARCTTPACFGFKCFLLHSGVDEFPPLDPDQLEAAMRELRSFDGLMIVHAEDTHAIEHAPTAHGETLPRLPGLAPARCGEPRRRPGDRAVPLDRLPGAHPPRLELRRRCRCSPSATRDGVRITAETCPHYLTFASEEIPDGATQYKCCPPIREAGNRELLWEGLRDGVIDLVVSDHSPSTPDLKVPRHRRLRRRLGRHLLAPARAVRRLDRGPAARLRPGRRLPAGCAEAPGAAAGLRRKGQIEIGYDADFAVFAPDDAFVVDAATPASQERRHAVRRSARSPASSAAPGCAAGAIDIDRAGRSRSAAC